LQAVYADIKAAGGELVVFSGETRDLSSQMATKQGLTFPLVADTGLAIAKSFGLVFVLPDDLKALYQSFGIDLPKNTGHPAWELPMPARYVVDRSGIIRSAEVDPDYTVRPEPSATLEILRSLA
jgi:peroxiredoxin